MCQSVSAFRTAKRPTACRIEDVRKKFFEYDINKKGYVSALEIMASDLFDDFDTGQYYPINTVADTIVLGDFRC